jgi:hypothetical protein
VGIHIWRMDSKVLFRRRVLVDGLAKFRREV